MSCFLTVHQPIPQEEDRSEYDNCIWVNQETPHWVHRINRSDRVFVYEIATSEHPGLVEVGGQLRSAYQPRGGLVSCFEVTSDFIPELPPPVTFERNIYLGKFQGDYISQRFIPLRILKEAWLRATGRNFNPLFKGGIRELNAEKCRVLSSLMGVSYP